MKKISYTKAGLIINGAPYRKKVVPPSPSELINMDPDLLEKLLKMKMDKSADIRVDGSIFTAYSAPVSSHQQVRDLYLRMRTIQPAARHIVCAYWVPHEEEYYALDYHDDGEPTAGRILMDLLQANNVKNRVVFVARRYGGIKMGADRFLCYLQAANQALKISSDIKIEDPRQIKKTRKPEAELMEVNDQQESQQTLQKQTTRKAFFSPRPSLSQQRHFRGKPWKQRGYNGPVRGQKPASTQNFQSNPRQNQWFQNQYQFSKPWSAMQQNETPEEREQQLN